jgi:hypothetical protein
MQQSREWMRRRRGAEGVVKPSRIERCVPPIPDNSEPWLPTGVRSIADAIWISDRIKEDMDRWRIKSTQDSCLLISKQETGRSKDTQDILFLESKIESEYMERVASVSEADALAMLNRFLTPAVAQSALQHSSALVRDHALSFLRELAAAGNPFTTDMLDEYLRTGLG